MKTHKHVEMHVEKHLFEIIKEYTKNKAQNHVKSAKNAEKFVRSPCLNLHLETNGLHHFLN